MTDIQGIELRCLACGADGVTTLLELGPQAVSNRFLGNPADTEFTHSWGIGQCPACATVQAVHPVPAEELVPPYDWIRYNEPERHLDALVAAVREVVDLTPESTICGLTRNDDPLLARFQQLGFLSTWRLDPSADLGITDPRAGPETLQAVLDFDAAADIARRRGPADLVVARFVLEHCHDLPGFLRVLRALGRSRTRFVLEVPDCTPAFERHDCTTLWEEHTLYFSPATFEAALEANGFAVERTEVYPFAVENALVAIARRATQPGRSIGNAAAEGAAAENERRRARAFASSIARQATSVRRFLSGVRERSGPVALFGAGHQACSFVNLLGLKDVIDFAVDDHPDKRGLYLAGSRLPILGSAALVERGAALCLLAINPEAEDKVMAKQEEFVRRGGRFHSIFPGRPTSIPLERLGA